MPIFVYFWSRNVNKSPMNWFKNLDNIICQLKFLRFVDQQILMFIEGFLNEGKDLGCLIMVQCFSHISIILVQIFSIIKLGMCSKLHPFMVEPSRYQNILN